MTIQSFPARDVPLAKAKKDPLSAPAEGGAQPSPTASPVPVYLDYAATTPLAPEALEAMLPFLEGHYANPSSTHLPGSQVRAAIERCRRQIRDWLGGGHGTLFFTSGGTEANNWAIASAVRAGGVRHLISSPLEHLSVVQAIHAAARAGEAESHWVGHSPTGDICYEELERLLKAYPGALVSLMHANNETGRLTDLGRVSALCQAHGALLHSDCVQTIGLCPPDLAQVHIDYCTASAHKFYGPKGVGFLYAAPGAPMSPWLHGGSQEREMRAGTEPVAAIVGMWKALELALACRQDRYSHLLQVRQYAMQQLQAAVPGVVFFALGGDRQQNIPSILSVGCRGFDTETLLLSLSMKGIALSSGSACSSGATEVSHVIKALGADDGLAILRFSFSHLTTRQEIDRAVASLASLQSAPPV